MESLILNFLWNLLTGEVFRLWAAHKAKEKARDIANAPVTKKEESDYFK